MIATEVRALSPDEPDPESETWIRKTPGVCGGDARIRNTRIPVWLLVEMRRLGSPDAELLEAYPSLNPADLAIAWAYYAAYRSEIDTAIREQDEV